MKRRQFLQAPLQLSLFDFEQVAEPAPVAGHPSRANFPVSPDSSGKTAPKRRCLPGAHAIDYSLRRSARRSIGFLIEEDGLRVTAPRWVTVAEIEDAIRSKLRWIVAKLDERRTRLAQQQEKAFYWHNGAILALLGKPLTLRTSATGDGNDVFDDASGTLTVPLPPDAPIEQLEGQVQRWFQNEAHRLFAQRLTIYAEKLGVSYQSFALSGANTQWGSCTAQGRIRLNWRLIHLPMHLIDYVIAHELAHLREMNHSAKFWATVESVFPEYESARKSLRAHSPNTSPAF